MSLTHVLRHLGGKTVPFQSAAEKSRRPLMAIRSRGAGPRSNSQDPEKFHTDNKKTPFPLSDGTRASALDIGPAPTCRDVREAMLFKELAGVAFPLS